MRALVLTLLTALVLVGCSSSEKQSDSRYTMRSDKAPDNPPDVSNVPDAVPVNLAYSRGGNKPQYEVWGKTYKVLDSHIGYVKEGIASWYGLKFHGHKTSNGEIYDIYKMSAAHKSLPIPSFARVTNLDNGKSVVVRVNDRGPFHEDRLIDLSYAAATRLDITQKGTGRVRVESIDASFAGSGEPTSVPIAAVHESGTRLANAEGQFLQIGAFGNEDNAQRAQSKLASLSNETVRVVPTFSGGQRMHRVVVGPLKANVALDQLIEQVVGAGYSRPILIDSL